MRDDAYLLLWLEAPLQSWGFDSCFGRRDSLDFPTRSGILGLLCCARGAGGGQQAWLAQWQGQDMQIAAYGSQSPPPLLEDFQMVGSGYDDSDDWQTLLIPKTADGKKAVGGGSKLTYRYYLQDMAFAVALQVPSLLWEETVAALRRPVWDICLGRKNCVPTDFIYNTCYAVRDEGSGQWRSETYDNCFDGAEAALRVGQCIADSKRRERRFCVLPGDRRAQYATADCELLTLNDVPLRFGPHKCYGDRQVTVIRERREWSGGGAGDGG